MLLLGQGEMDGRFLNSRGRGRAGGDKSCCTPNPTTITGIRIRVTIVVVHATYMYVQYPPPPCFVRIV